MSQNNDDYIRAKFGNRLREIRESYPDYKDIKDFEKKTGISKDNLYKYEEGKSIPPIPTFIKICKVLDKTPSFMLSPFLDISPKDEELLKLFSKMKELRNDPDAWEIIEFIVLGLDIYSMEKRKDTLKDIINILDSVKNILSRKRA